MKTLILKTIALVFFLSTSSLFAQVSTDNMIFVNQQGEEIPFEEIAKLGGKVKMQQKVLDNGKIQMTVIPISEEDQKASKAKDEAWKKKWIGQQLPNFSMKTSQGEKVTNKDLKGKLAVFNFWFIGCKPCVREMPELNKIVEKYSNNDKIVFLAPNGEDTKEKLTAFTAKRSFKYEVLADAKAFNETLGVYSFPSNFIVDENGIIQEVVMGASSDIAHKLETLIEKHK